LFFIAGPWALEGDSAAHNYVIMHGQGMANGRTDSDSMPGQGIQQHQDADSMSSHGVAVPAMNY
jgi:hypothetical protein